ncbi:hypothetical protein QO001_006136 [Methylobacterium brachiatum]|uniref:Uncharacterized protein n=1 Tax=Methylobacterium brachiatum TaxID=269660 RepID=A0AAJ1WZN4_9HYPH|nr:hypothetical protein [Methylobacterium brachiatum]
MKADITTQTTPDPKQAWGRSAFRLVRNLLGVSRNTLKQGLSAEVMQGGVTEACGIWHSVPHNCYVESVTESTPAPRIPLIQRSRLEC